MYEETREGALLRKIKSAEKMGMAFFIDLLLSTSLLIGAVGGAGGLEKLSTKELTVMLAWWMGYLLLLVNITATRRFSKVNILHQQLYLLRMLGKAEEPSDSSEESLP